MPPRLTREMLFHPVAEGSAVSFLPTTRNCDGFSRGFFIVDVFMVILFCFLVVPLDVLDSADLLHDGFAVMRRAREGMLSESKWGRIEGAPPLTMPPLPARHPLK